MGKVVRAAALALLALFGAFVIAAMKRTAVGVSAMMVAVWAHARARGSGRLATSAALASLTSFALAYLWPAPRQSWAPAAALSLALLFVDVGAASLSAAYSVLGRPLPAVASRPSEIVESELAARGRARCFLLLSREGARHLGAFAPVKAMGYRRRYWYAGKIARLAAAGDCVVELVVSGGEAEVVAHFRAEPSRAAAEALALSKNRAPAARTRVAVAKLVEEFDALAALGWGRPASPRPASAPAMYAPLRERLAGGGRCAGR